MTQYVAGIGEKRAFRILVVKSFGKWPIDRPGRR
jgi:hypothetical protein